MAAPAPVHQTVGDGARLAARVRVPPDEGDLAPARALVTEGVIGAVVEEGGRAHARRVAGPPD